MKTWNVTDASGDKHVVTAERLTGVDEYREFSNRDPEREGFITRVAVFTKPIAVTEGTQHLIDPETGEDRGQVCKVTWQTGEGDDEHKAYLVLVKRNS